MIRSGCTFISDVTSSAPVALLATWPGDQEWLAVNSSQHTWQNSFQHVPDPLVPILTPQVSETFNKQLEDVVLAAFKTVAAKKHQKEIFGRLYPRTAEEAAGFGVGVLLV